MIFVYIVKWFAIYTDISETDIMMYVNYTSIKNNFKKEESNAYIDRTSIKKTLLEWEAEKKYMTWIERD